MNFLRTVFCFCLLMTVSNTIEADNRDHDESAKAKSKHSIEMDVNSNTRLEPAMKKLERWIASLEQELPKEIDKSIEKLMVSKDKPAELTTKLFDILAQSDQQFEPDEKTVFGEKLEKFSIEDRRKLVVAWTAQLQEFLRKRVIKISDKLSQSSSAKAKELSEILRGLSKAHSEAYEQYKKESKTSNDPKLFCFACDGHIGDFNYHDDMERQISSALSAWSSGAGSSANSKSPEQEKPKSNASANETKSEVIPPGQGNFEKYKASLINGRPNPSMYPQPENMAPVLGLTSPEGFSYMKWKGKGQHFVRGPQGNEYGVEVDWTLLRGQSLGEQKRVLGILEQVLAAGVQPFKVVRANNDGYCLWCNIANYGPSTAEISALRARVR